MLRYLIGLVATSASVGKFPLGTFVCNIVGCLLIGLLSALASRLGWSEETRLLLTVGLCGGFTTFSTFSRESLNLLTSGETLIFAVYLLSSIVLGIAAVWAGSKCAAWL